MDFSYNFPAVKGIQAGHEYYISMVPLKLLSKLFPSEEEIILPEFRAQRRVNEARIPEIKQYIMEDLQLFEEDLDLTNSTEFWFKHNGVTIFVDGNQLNVIDTIIQLHSEKVSVINGAQTMTNLYKLLYENKYCLKKMYNAKEFEFIQKKYSKIHLYISFTIFNQIAIFILSGF